MTSEERSRLEKLDRILRSASVRKQIAPVISRVCAELKRKPEALMTWEPIPLEVFGEELPAEIQSSWVFVLRAGADTGPERHRNSHQRMMSLGGSGDMRTLNVKSLNRYKVKSGPPSSGSRRTTVRQGAAGHWRSNLLISDPAAPLEQRWISIPPNVWHRPVISKDADWVVISFHTVPAGELIEERPGLGSGDETRQMRYLDQ
jgi:hypothetical protein